MDYDIPGQTVRIDTAQNDEARVNAAGVTVTVAETGRLLGGFVFNAGGSRLVIDDGGAVVRSTNPPGTTGLAITGSTGADTVINNGAITGNIGLGDGDDQFTTTRLIDGRIDLGAGNDVIRMVDQQSFVSTFVDGGSGDDRLELVNSGLSSSVFTVRNIETLVLDGAFDNGFSGGLRITSLWDLTGVRQLTLIGDPATVDPFTNGPQFYVRQSDIAAAAVQFTGRGTLYLDNSSVGTVTGDAASNVLVLWGTARVTTSIDLGDGDDVLSIRSSATNALVAKGGAGNDQISIDFSSGGTIALDLANVTGFETIIAFVNPNLSGSLALSNLVGATRLDFTSPIAVSLANTTAPELAISTQFKSLAIAAGSVVGQIGQNIGFFTNTVANPFKSITIQNDGAIRGSVQFDEGDDRYDGRAGLVSGIVDGAAGNDVLLGGAAADTFRGGLGADRLEGNGGDDVLTGGAGTDTLLGGAGFDTAVFAGARLDYEITRSGESVVVRDLRGSDGTDTLTGVERLAFSDGLMGLLPEELLLFLPGGRDLIAWDSTRGANGFSYFLQLDGSSSAIAVADLTGDGRSDILLQQPGGGLIRWDPSQGGNGFAVLPATPGFDVVALGDIGGNAASEIVLKNAAGQLRVIDPETGVISDLFSLAAGWRVAGIANINGSGKDDVVLHNSTSGAVIAFTEQGWRDLLTITPGSGFEIAGFGDVVGGLADDLILRNRNTGVTIFWDATRGSEGWQDFATIGPQWKIAGFSDLNGDGRDDVLLQNDNGLAIYWTGSTWVDLGSVLVDTQLVGTGVFP